MMPLDDDDVRRYAMGSALWLGNVSGITVTNCTPISLFFLFLLWLWLWLLLLLVLVLVLLHLFLVFLLARFCSISRRIYLAPHHRRYHGLLGHARGRTHGQ
jgi:predicted transcriptional regulator